MGTFDNLLEQFGDSAGDLFGSDAGDLLDNVQHAFADRGDGSESGGDADDGGNSWTDTLGGLFGGGSDDGEDDGDSGGWGALGGLVDRLSGDGDGADDEEGGFFSNVIDKATSFLPEDLRDEAESLFRGGEDGSSWAGSLLDRVTDGRSPQPDDFDDLVTGRPATMNGNAAADGHVPDDTLVSIDDPTFPDGPALPDDVNPAVTGSVDDGLDSGDVNPPPMDDFQQEIAQADQIDDSFDNMFEGLE